MQNRKLNSHLNLADLEEVSYSLNCAVDVADAIQVAMESGPFDPSNYLSALRGSVMLLQYIASDLDSKIYSSEEEL